MDLPGNHNTGLAVANLTEKSSYVSISGLDRDGENSIGAYGLPLASYGHGAKFASEFAPNWREGFTDVLDIKSETPFAALTLRSLYNERGDILITTFPIADANQAAPSPVVFPQIVDGGGYATEFILVSPSRESITTLNFYSETGAPLPVGNW